MISGKHNFEPSVTPQASSPRHALKSNNKKRRNDDDGEQPQRPTAAAQFAGVKKPVQGSRFKKSKTPRILGQSLPVTRLIQVLDHQSLQNLLQAVMTYHPEVAQTVVKVAPTPSVGDTIEFIKQKAAAVKDNLPYKCDMESDYSYIRIKPHLSEFLHCISDFILNILPPVESSLLTSCNLMNVITVLIHELPNFSNKEYQYTKAMAYEQIANSWLIILNSHKGTEESESGHEENTPANIERSIEWAKTIEEMNLLEQVQEHNNITQGKFSAVVDFVKTELDAFSQNNHGISSTNSGSIFNDLITVDYSNYSMTARTMH